MSTSIQEQDLIQTIKQLEQRLSDVERQQRAIATDATGTKTVEVKTNFSSVQSERMNVSSNGIEYYYADISGPVVDETAIINFNTVGFHAMLTSDFGRGSFIIGADLDFVIDQHDVSIPSTPTSTGTKGTIKWNASHIYVCTATNTWRRVAVGTW